MYTLLEQVEFKFLGELSLKIIIIIIIIIIIFKLRHIWWIGCYLRRKPTPQGLEQSLWVCTGNTFDILFLMAARLSFMANEVVFTMITFPDTSSGAVH